MIAKTCEISAGHNKTASRKRRRSREERGLPDEQSRIDLAETYLEIQQVQWPELVASGDLPGLSNESVATLADDFRRRFLSDDPSEELRTCELPEEVTLGSAYLRYSCDNSNPRSLAQQLRNVLERSARDRVFIPWELVFADAAVSGTTANRRGYQLAKESVQLEDGPKTLYVDELVNKIVDQANAALVEEEAKPPEDMQPIAREIKEIKAKRGSIGGDHRRSLRGRFAVIAQASSGA